MYINGLDPIQLASSDHLQDRRDMWGSDGAPRNYSENLRGWKCLSPHNKLKSSMTKTVGF
jgi:hypothetical protein